MGVAIGLYGSTLKSTSVQYSDPDEHVQTLERTFRRRAVARFFVVALLGLALLALLLDTWFPALLP